MWVYCNDMSTVVEVPVPGWNGWYARMDGSVRDPNNRIIWGSSNKLGHKCFYTKNPFGQYETCWVHRFVAMAFCPNPLPEVFTEVDHIDRDPTNNKPENLRWLTRALNQLNKKCKNCEWCRRKKRFRCFVTISGKRHNLGYFFTQEECSAVAFEFKLRELERIYMEILNAHHENTDG